MEDFTHRSPLSQRLLVIGVDGVVGANLALALSDRFAVRGLYQHQAVELEGCQTAPWRPGDLAGLDSAVRQHRPQWIVYCGALASSSWDLPEQVPDAAEESRTLSRLARLAHESDAQWTVVSTDAVFAGPRMFHGENDPAASRSPLARAVRQAEQAALQTEGLVVRTHAYGWCPTETDSGFAQRVWRSLVEGAACSPDPYQHATPILATDLAELLWLAYRRGLRGLYHLAGAERTSAYRFAGELAAAFGLDNRRAPAQDHALETRRPAGLLETSLSTRRARCALGRSMPMLREGLERFAHQAANGFRSRLRAATRLRSLVNDAA